MSLSEHIRAGAEAAPWVVEQVAVLERQRDELLRIGEFDQKTMEQLLEQRDRLLAQRDRLLAAAKEYIAAADGTVNPPNGGAVAAMIRFGEADTDMRAAIREVGASDG